MSKNFKQRFLKHLGRVGIAIITTNLIVFPSLALDQAEAASQVIGSEGGKESAKAVLNGALKAARSKPAMTTATAIVCISCVPAAGAAASPGLCIACGILIAKTFG